MRPRCGSCGHTVPEGHGNRCPGCPPIANGADHERKAMFLLMPVPKRPATYQEIAEALGCSKARVQQIGDGALRKLRALGLEAFRKPDEEKSMV